MGFSLDPGHPAAYGPGRRPPHTLSPLVVTDSSGRLDSVLADAVSGVADEAANLIGEFDEGFSNRQTWLLSAMYFCYGYDIGVFLSWFPKYLSAARGFDLARMGFYASLPLIAGLIGDISGGLTSDLILKRTGNVKFSRRIVSVVGFGLSSVAVTLAALAADPMISIAWFCLGVFALELTVGVSWAVTLDVGGEFAGSASAVMNTLGNIGASLTMVATPYITKTYN